MENENTHKKIIIVDDNIAYLSMVRNLLRSYYEVYPAPSAEKLFAAMEKFIPDLVLLDVDMPVTDGFKAMALMKENPRYKDIPVIFLTAKDDESNASRGLDLGAADYIAKPFFGSLLFRRIENILLMEQQKRELRELEACRAELDVLRAQLENQGAAKNPED